jgi:hypothetical protein
MATEQTEIPAAEEAPGVRRFERSELQSIQMGVLFPIAEMMKIHRYAELTRAALVEKIYVIQHLHPKAMEALIEKLAKIEDNQRRRLAEDAPKTVRVAADGTEVPVKPREKSAADSPVKRVWAICNSMPNAARKHIITKCIEQGVNPNTAATQYAAWKRDRAANAVGA